MASNPAQPHGIKDNHRRGRVADFLSARITQGTRLSVVSAYFTIYAYDALREQLDSVESLQFLFGEPRFIQALDPEKTDKKAFKIEDEGLALANRLQQKDVARRCADWIRDKVEIRSIRESNLLHGKLYHIDDGKREHALMGSSNFTRFDGDIAKFNRALAEALMSIEAEAQRFYDEHFAEPNATVELKVGMTTEASKYDRYAHKFSVPCIGFEVKLNGAPLRKPQSFLNEAKLTQLALSVRFGATLAHLHDSPMRLLVLDDLLISLDMNNRMKVVYIILSDTFADHQKIILTHDLGFFNEFRRRIGGQHTEWSFQRFAGTAETGIQLHEEKTPFRKPRTISTGTTWTKQPFVCAKLLRTRQGNTGNGQKASSCHPENFSR